MLQPRGDPEACGRDRGDAARGCTSPKFLIQLLHPLTDPCHKAGGGGLRDHGPASLHGDIFGPSEHDGLADPPGAGEDGEQSGRSGANAKPVFELVQDT